MRFGIQFWEPRVIRCNYSSIPWSRWDNYVFLEESPYWVGGMKVFLLRMGGLKHTKAAQMPCGVYLASSPSQNVDLKRQETIMDSDYPLVMTTIAMVKPWPIDRWFSQRTKPPFFGGFSMAMLVRTRWQMVSVIYQRFHIFGSIKTTSLWPRYKWLVVSAPNGLRSHAGELLIVIVIYHNVYRCI